MLLEHVGDRSRPFLAHRIHSLLLGCIRAGPLFLHQRGLVISSVRRLEVRICVRIVLCASNAARFVDLGSQELRVALCLTDHEIHMLLHILLADLLNLHLMLVDNQLADLTPECLDVTGHFRSDFLQVLLLELLVAGLLPLLLLVPLHHSLRGLLRQRHFPFSFLPEIVRHPLHLLQ